MIRGTIPITWSENDYKNLSWTPPAIIQHQSSFEILNGAKLNNENVVYICNQNLPDVFIEVGKIFNLDKTVCVINKMNPGAHLPFHKDNYPTYTARNNIKDNDKLTRIIVFLHDQKPGHQLWIEDSICMGPAGSYFGWNNDTPHMAANLGYETRYVLQITGLSK